MSRTTAPGTAIERLIEHIFGDDRHGPMADELAGWLAGSRRFRAFVETHRDKIRKKMRSATDPEARRDVRTELRVAQLLLADRGIALAFEAYGSTRGGPDFTVTYRGDRPFNLEVTRQRRAPDAAGYGGPLLAKLRQLPPSVPNVVLVAIDGARADAFDVAAVTRALRARADADGDEDFFTARGLRGTRGFHDRFLRLGSVLVWCEGAAGDARAGWWANRSARIAVPERSARACLAALRGG